MTQNCLSIVLKTLHFFNDVKTPKSFDESAQIILNKNDDKIEYNKKWYCYMCKKYVEIEKNKSCRQNKDDENKRQRKCIDCNERFLNNSNFFIVIVFFKFL